MTNPRNHAVRRSEPRIYTYSWPYHYAAIIKCVVDVNPFYHVKWRVALHRVISPIQHCIKQAFPRDFHELFTP